MIWTPWRTGIRLIRRMCIPATKHVLSYLTPVRRTWLARTDEICVGCAPHSLATTSRIVSVLGGYASSTEDPYTTTCCGPGVPWAMGATWVFEVGCDDCVVCVARSTLQACGLCCSARRACAQLRAVHRSERSRRCPDEVVTGPVPVPVAAVCVGLHFWRLALMCQQ